MGNQYQVIQGGIIMLIDSHVANASLVKEGDFIGIEFSIPMRPCRAHAESSLSW